jgi:hypothetical protein
MLKKSKALYTIVFTKLPDFSTTLFHLHQGPDLPILMVWQYYYRLRQVRAVLGKVSLR